MATANPDLPPLSLQEIEEDDLPLLRQLAQLQELHDQLNSLRTLLPRRLLAPITSALHPNGTIKPSAPQASSISSGVNGSPRAPSTLFSDLQRIAKDGVEEVDRFKSAWHDETMENLWKMGKDASMKGFEAGQGSDVWAVDYVGLVKGRTGKETSTTGVKAEGMADMEEDTVMQQGDEDVGKIVEEYSSQSPGMKIQRVEEGDSPQLIGVTISGVLKFEVLQEGGVWITRTVKDTPSNEMQRNVLEQINHREKKESLRFLLDMMSSYKNIRTQPCAKCSKVFDKRLQLPFLRKHEEVTVNAGETAGKKSKWSALHKDCT